MPDLSWSHILLVLIVVLVVVGPKDLPRLMRTMGQWMAKAREMAGQLRTSFDDMTRQAELDELRRELDALRGHQPFAGQTGSASASTTGPDRSTSSTIAPEPHSVGTPGHDEGRPSA